jgi:hypothetical protein
LTFSAVHRRNFQSCCDALPPAPTFALEALTAIAVYGKTLPGRSNAFNDREAA